MTQQQGGTVPPYSQPQWQAYQPAAAAYAGIPGSAPAPSGWAMPQPQPVPTGWPGLTPPPPPAAPPRRRSYSIGGLIAIVALLLAGLLAALAFGAWAWQSRYSDGFTAASSVDRTDDPGDGKYDDEGKCVILDDDGNVKYDDDGNPIPCPDEEPTTPPDYGANNPDGTCQGAIANESGYPGPTTATVKDLTDVDVQRLGTECSAWTWRGSPHSTRAVCPDDFVCTFTLANGRVRVYLGNGQEKNITAATWRYASVYSEREGDPCEILRKEYHFGVEETPDFESLLANDSNFTCNGWTAVYDGSDTTTGGEVTSASTSGGNPADGRCKNADQVVADTGGTSDPKYWWLIAPGQWKYGKDNDLAPKVKLTAPAYGSIDIDPRANNGDGVLTNGESAFVVIATLNCG